MARRGKTSSTDRLRTQLTAEIDQAVAAWVDAGLVDATEWMTQGRRPVLVTPIPAQAGTWFDPAAVERVLKFFLLLKQLIGRHSGRQFRLMDWQVRYLVAPVFGLKRPDGYRVIRTVWFEIPRKNGKSTLCSGLGLYLAFADREAGAEVYAAAGDRDQANIVFRAAANMASGSPPLKKKLGRRGIQRKLLEHPVTHSIFRALSSEGLRAHGLNVHGGVVDEVHVHRNPDVIDALETGVGSRTQPLIVFITTADDGAETGSVYATKREEIETLAGRHAEDPTVFGVVFGADQEAAEFDPFTEDTLRTANPGYGVTVLADYLEGKARQAERSPAQLNRYLRLHLNIRTKQTTRWLAMDDWDRSGRDPGSLLPVPVELDELEGRDCYGGLDLSSTTDMTAFSLWFPPQTDDPAEPHIWVPFFWLPEDNIDKLERRTKVPLQRWAEETPGHAGQALRLTEGNVVDYRAVRSLITDDLAKRFNILAVGYDRWNATETVSELMDAGVQMEQVSQGYAGLNQPCQQLERLVLSGRIVHGGHPILRWHVDCVGVKANSEGHVKPVKPDRQLSTKRIDGVASGLNALAMHLMRAEPEEEPEPNIRIIS
ncbi:terminase large subunit [Streptomyces albipurpureus]|uniref:Terminase large subunit n=1 Tax=Streptomyces albipurpureus TaxID=2897419 RepID=A0ABT0UQ11_9ACTN|nr:terminase TerL endonuclease subunit [Streptomyces sp. CWNU-1]MCM2390185.1 terminase large subunit [Streptomyces sp. CWNU-1]